MDVFKERIQKGRTRSNSNETEVENFSGQKMFFSDPLPTIKEVEKKLIETAMERANNNQTIAAQMIGLTRSALNKRLNRPAQDIK